MSRGDDRMSKRWTAMSWVQLVSAAVCLSVGVHEVMNRRAEAALFLILGLGWAIVGWAHLRSGPK